MKRAILGLSMAMATLAQAPTQGPPPDDSDAAQHGVARISLMQGSVSVLHGDAADATGAVMNAPVVATDRVVTGDGSRAEVQFDAANMIRLAPSTEVRFSELAYKHYQVQIAEGTVLFRVLRDNDAQMEISTPTVSVRPTRNGSYRVTVRPDGTTQIVARQGAADIFGPRGSENLSAGQTMEARGTAADPEFQIVGALPMDEWDRWNSDRDRVFQQAVSGRYTSPDIYGTESLDPYGQWQNDPQYGNVWVPAVAPDWAPYQLGRWTWIDYYGWTWVSADPWGWAPYHYGRWYRGAFGWAWWPGAIGHTYWSPALVGFFGWGGGVGFGVGFGFGHVGWVPLAPFEAYRPWYGRGYAGRINVVNNVNIVNTYRNARFTNAITSVRAGEFGRGAVHSGNIVRASTADLTRAGAVRGALPITASAASRRFLDTPVTSRGMPQTSANRQFYSRSGGQAAARAVAPNGGSFQPTQVNRGNTGTVSNGAGAQNTGGWRRLNSSPGTSRGATAQPGYGNSSPAGQSRSYTPQQNIPQNRGYTPQQSNVPPSRSYTQQNIPQNRGYTPPARSAAPQTPVRINPPIVQNRGSAGGSNSHPQSHAGSFGGAHAGGGGGGASHSGGGRR